MTEIQFHFNVPDRLLYACRLLRKALHKVEGVTVSGPADLLQRLDRLLWTFEATEFLPHVLLKDGHEPLTARLRATPIWLSTRLHPQDPHPVLVHLGPAPAEGFEKYGRLVEVVSQDPECRDAGRRRWKHYTALGHAIRTHEVAA